MELSLPDILSRLGIPKETQPPVEQLAAGLMISLLTSVLIFFIFGRRQRKKHRKLREQLEEALSVIDRLEIELEEQEQEEAENLKKQNKEIRVWMDGAFDMFHYGRKSMCISPFFSSC